MRTDPVRSQIGSETGFASEPGATIAVERLEAFLRQLSHDVRNDLNAMDLLTSYVEDLQPEGSVREALSQLHDSVRYGSQRMQRLSRAVQICDPEWIPYPSDLLFEDVRARYKLDRPEVFERTNWERLGARVVVAVDPGLVMEALLELLDNALGFSPSGTSVRVFVESQEHGVLWRIEQVADKCPADISQWGRRPLESTRSSRYGLGLFRVRRIVEAHNANLNFFHQPDGQLLVTEVWFGGSLR